MARYKDVEGYRKLFDEEYKKTRKLISEGETHLDNLAEGFSEASRVIDRMPTADVAPKSEVARLEQDVTRLVQENEDLKHSNEHLVVMLEETKIELEAMRGAANSYKMHYENLAREIFEELETVLCCSAYPRVNANRTITVVKSKDFHIRCDDYDELKKKYTEGKQ